MSAYINVGAFDHLGRRFPTKKSLRQAMAENPQHVTFDRTSMLAGAGSDINGADLPNGVLVVVGPDPYSDRRWYANVCIGRSGKVQVS